MGADANVLAIGRFSKEIASLLDYDEDWYEGVPDGYPVTTHLFLCNTTDQSRLLCEALGCAWTDFSTFFLRFKDTVRHEADMHYRMTRMDGVVVNMHVLVALQQEGGFGEWAEDEIDQFITLAENGFRFFFQPNC
jgi:hypothetical protein